MLSLFLTVLAVHLLVIIGIGAVALAAAYLIVVAPSGRILELDEERRLYEDPADDVAEPPTAERAYEDFIEARDDLGRALMDTPPGRMLTRLFDWVSRNREVDRG